MGLKPKPKTDKLAALMLACKARGWRVGLTTVVLEEGTDKERSVLSAVEVRDVLHDERELIARHSIGVVSIEHAAGKLHETMKARDLLPD